MSVGIDRTILLRGDELMLLLGGCGIEDLLLPESISVSLSEAGAARVLVRLSRDGLLPAASDGVLDYEGELREALSVLRDCTDELVLWVSGRAVRPFCLYLAKDSSQSVLLRSDAGRQQGISLSVGIAEVFCASALAEACSASVLPRKAQQPHYWPWEDFSGEGILLRGLRFVREIPEPVSIVLVVKTTEGNRIAEWCDGNVHLLPFTASSLLPQNRRDA